MNPQEPIQAEDDEISLIDILLFLQASFSNVVKSLVGCLFVGGIYYFSIPEMYEASATIEMATVVGEPVETPARLLEKMKLPMYFSTATLQACGTDGGLSSQSKFVDKIKPSINKSAPMVSFVTQAPSSQEAKACLNAAIADVSSKQDAIANPLLSHKKQKLIQLGEQLKIAEETGKSLPSFRLNNNMNDTQSMASVLVLTLKKTNDAEINDLRLQISSLQYELIEPKTRPTYLVNTIFATGVAVNKRSSLFILGLCLALGVFLGLLVTGIMRMSPGVLRQIREAESMVR
jgi:hypothetical protein